MSVKGQPFGLNFNSNPSYTIAAMSIGLSTFAAAIVDNRGPGAVLLFPSGTPAGTPSEIIGANQRKLVILGNVADISVSMPLAFSSTAGAAAAAVWGTTAAAGVLVMCDQYELIGASDWRTGNSVEVQQVFFGGPTSVNQILLATDCGFDRIRGIYVPPQSALVEITSPTYNTGFLQPRGVLAGVAGSAIDLDTTAIEFGLSDSGTEAPCGFIVSDEPIAASGSGGGTYG